MMMRREMIQNLMLFLVSCLFLVSHGDNTSSVSSGQHCLPQHSSALLQLRQEFDMKKPFYFEYYNTTSYPKMKNWKANTDCCSWDGVTCNNKTGQVVGLDLSDGWLSGPLNPNSSLFSLRLLQKLNLGSNNFSFSTIPSEFGQFTRLSHLNLSSSRFSGQVPSEISQLINLVSLDLSASFDQRLRLRRIDLEAFVKNMTSLEELHLDFLNISSSLPEFLVNLSSLTSLSLSDCSLHGKFPKNIFILPKIQVINLSDNEFLAGVLPEFPFDSSLKNLDLTYTNFSGKLPDSIGNLKSLNYLSLHNCNFSGIVPPSLGNLSHLTVLYLENNHFHGKLPSTLGNLTKLTVLSLKNDIFSGTIPSSLGNLSQLTELHLGNNLFGGKIPSSLGNLTQLEVLDLSNNNLTDMFPISLTKLSQLVDLVVTGNQLIGPIPSEISKISKLSFLDLSKNSLTGAIPSSLFTIPSLRSINLEQNQLVGPLEFQNLSSSNLEYLSLSGNKLNKTIPRSIANLTNLDTLYLSSINMKGMVDLNIFFKLERLVLLDLSRNNLSIIKGSISSAIPKFFSLNLSSCNIGEFPDFIETQDELQILDLSNNRIEGKIPKWFWNVGVETFNYLDLSNNLLSSFEQPPTILPWKKIFYLDLHSNLLQGSVPIPSLSTMYFFASKNKFTGRIPPNICKLSFLEVLDLSDNQLSGPIPQCLGNFSSSLSVLNLRRNKFQGKLPLSFTNGRNLRTLDFSHNQIQGEIPRSLVNCKKLEVLNLGNNNMSDTFPFWLGSLPELKILVLRENGFHGPIQHPHTNFSFPKLHIIDLSHNSFTGEFPSKYFTTWNAMLSILDEEKSNLNYLGDGYYEDSMTVVNKGVELELVKILTIFTAIDLSNNKFEGEIPNTVGNLKALIVLNFSSNSFTSPIPSSLSNLKELESLDLSQNKLSGEIPQQLTSLTFLSYLNLSQNQLVGPIPQGAQFGTFPNSSFEANLGLCGSPLSKKCGNSETPASASEQGQESSFGEGFNWKVVVMGYACGVLIGLVTGHILTAKRPGWFARTFGVNLRRRR